MALFGFSDIIFNKGSTTTRGPLASIVDSQFERTTLRYPIDVGNYDKGHYVVFYVRQQNKSSFQRETVSDFEQFSGGLMPSGNFTLNDLANPQNMITRFGNELIGKVNNGLNSLNKMTGGLLTGVTGAISKAAGGLIGGISQGIGDLFGGANISLGGGSAGAQSLIDNSIKRIKGGSLDFLRTTKLTTDAIALYMPDTLNYSYTQSYDQLSLGAEGGGQLLAAGKSAVDAYRAGGSEEALSSAMKSAVNVGAQKAGKALASWVVNKRDKL